jgi:RNA polymerase sigma factor (sigma-70 family)
MPANRILPGSRSFLTLFSAGNLGALSDRDLLACFQSDPGPAAQEAFRILVERHGPMVLGLCRSLVRDQHEAEDAFQATFLVLVRKAASIERRDTVAPWLYGVASRVARRARTRLLRRQQREVPVTAEVPACDRRTSDEFATEQLLHEEITRLPETFRKPVILCCLQGLSYDLAAQTLGLKEPTLRGRLERAKKRLAMRLRARGVPAVLAGPALESVRGGMPPLPTALIESTIQFSARWSSVTGLLGGGAVVPASISALAQGVIQSMCIQTIRAGALGLVAVGAIGTMVLAQQGNGRSPAGGAPAGSDAAVGVEQKAINSGSAAPAQDERANAEKAERTRLQHAASQRAPTELKNARIRQRLDLVIDVVYPEGGNLEVLLKHIKQVTTDEKYPGIPIYVDPFGLSDVDKSMSTKVALDFKQQSIRSVLHYTLRPLGLSYDVRDGFLMISSRTGILENRVEDIDRKLDRVLEMLQRLAPAK